MKNFAVIHVLLLLLLVLVFQIVDAQDYVLTNRGDSVVGQVKPLLFGPEKKVQVTGENKEKTSFSIFEVRSFSSEGEIYHPVKGEAGYVFMKLLQPGYLSLYAYQLENQSRFDGLFLKKMDGATLVVPNLGFKKYLGKFLEDCPDVVTRIKEGELTRKNLPEVIDAYNACVGDRTVDHEKVIAEKKEQTTVISAWDALEVQVEAADFSEKNNALEMIAEIRKKIRDKEKIPNFLVEGLKSSLQSTGLTAALDKAIEETLQ